MKSYLKFFEFVVSVLISVGFIYLFFKIIGINNLKKFFVDIAIFNILLAFVLYVFSYYLRALRWKLTLNIKDMKKLFKITTYNTLFNIFLPFRTGELSFFYMLKKEGIPISSSAVSFFTVRFFDAYALGVVFLFSFFSFKFGLNIGLLVLFLSTVFIAFIKYLVKFIPFQKFKEFDKDTLTLQNVYLLYVFSLTTFFLKFFAFYLVLPDSLNISLIKAIFASSAGDLTTILPIHGLAGIGTYEGGFAGILILLGIDKDTSLISAVFVHIFILIASAVLGLLVKVYSYFAKI